MEKVRHQGKFESLHRDLIVGLEIGTFLRWISKFHFPDNEGSVHLWKGHDDKIVARELNCYLEDKLPWIQYHDLGMFGWAYLTLLKPPSSNVCGSPGGPPMISPKVQLSVGRYVAYKEGGVAKEKATYKITIVHGFDSSEDLMLPISQDKYLPSLIWTLGEVTGGQSGEPQSFGDGGLNNAKYANPCIQTVVATAICAIIAQKMG
ncbi:hypothetical protein RDI58_017470 [Solanum bulbocastanum]|uniref:Uncharacterized protein n=1 Tax=Solanum bulbocastanum TaxID=147425 RepID=A0AAN8YA02_SOLBU